MRSTFRPYRLLWRALVFSLLAAAGAPMLLAQPKGPHDGVGLAESEAKSNGTRLTARKVSTSDRIKPSGDRRAQAEKHPLWPALELAVNSYKGIRRNVRDYSCSLVRQERVNGRLQTPEVMTAKVRHQRTRNGSVAIPFALYLKIHSPERVKGREVLFVDGKNDGNMFVRNGGRRFAFVTAKIKPDSQRAMIGNRYPVTEFGFENLVKRLIEVVKEGIRANTDTHVEFFPNASINGVSCTGIRVSHPNFNPELRFHSANVFIHNELNVPVHYEAYGWPKEAGEEPPLLERYTYRNIKLNEGFSKADFDPANPNYKLK